MLELEFSKKVNIKPKKTFNFEFSQFIKFKLNLIHINVIKKDKLYISVFKKKKLIKKYYKKK